MSEKKVSLLNKTGIPSIVCHVEAIRLEIVLEVFNCFL